MRATQPIRLIDELHRIPEATVHFTEHGRHAGEVHILEHQRDGVHLTHGVPPLRTVLAVVRERGRALAAHPGQDQGLHPVELFVEDPEFVDAGVVRAVGTTLAAQRAGEGLCTGVAGGQIGGGGAEDGVKVGAAAADGLVAVIGLGGLEEEEEGFEEVLLEDVFR